MAKSHIILYERFANYNHDHPQNMGHVYLLYPRMNIEVHFVGYLHIYTGVLISP